jgi:hypothetical protein
MSKSVSVGVMFPLRSYLLYFTSDRLYSISFSMFLISLLCVSAFLRFSRLDSSLLLSYPNLLNPILSYPILPYPILSSPLLSYPILSYPTLSYPILSYPILPYPILSYPTLS